MKKIILVLFIFSIMAFSTLHKSFAYNYCGRASMKGGYLLDESSGDAIDCSSNGNDGTLVNSPTQGATGQFGTSYDFNQADTEYVDFGNIADFSIPGDLTVTFWVDPDDVATDIFIVIEGGTGETEAENSIIYLNWSTSGNIRYIHEYSTGSNETYTFNTGVSTSGFTFIYLVRDVSSNTVKVYKDCTIVGTFTYTNDPTVGAGTTAKFTLASRDGTGAAADGKFDEVAIFAEAMDADTYCSDIMTNGLYEASSTTNVPQIF